MKKLLSCVLAFWLILSAAAAEYDPQLAPASLDEFYTAGTVEDPCLLIPASLTLIDRMRDEFGIRILVEETVPEEIGSIYYEITPIVCRVDDPKAPQQRFNIWLTLHKLYDTIPQLPEALRDAFDGKMIIYFVDGLSLIEYDMPVHAFCYPGTDGVRVIFDYDAFQPYQLAHEGWHAYELMRGLEFQDWDRFNPEGFQYSRRYDTTVGFDPEWFYRSYGTVDPLEDRATVFEAYFEKKEKWWEAHPKIRAKLEEMLRSFPEEHTPEEKEEKK